MDGEPLDAAVAEKYLFDSVSTSRLGDIDGERLANLDTTGWGDCPRLS